MRGADRPDRSPDSPRQAPCDDGLDHLGREKGEREGHTDRALAAAFADGNLVGAGNLTGEKLLEPSPAARDRLEDAADLDPALVERDPMQMVEDQIAVAQLRVRRGCRPQCTDHERLDLRCWNAGYRSSPGPPLQDGLGDVVAIAA